MMPLGRSCFGAGRKLSIEASREKESGLFYDTGGRKQEMDSDLPSPVVSRVQKSKYTELNNAILVRFTRVGENSGTSARKYTLLSDISCG